jgi:hypothetical protein
VEDGGAADSCGTINQQFAADTQSMAIDFSGKIDVKPRPLDSFLLPTDWLFASHSLPIPFHKP